MTRTATPRSTRTTKTCTTTRRPGGEKRGNNQDRKNRKLWLLRTYGNGETCACVHCTAVLTYETLEADRIVPGGSYRHENVQPSCAHCNKARSNNASWTLTISVTITVGA
jgi:hypothetical protein